jgi:N-acetylglucosamine malate deacetylase 2
MSAEHRAAGAAEANRARALLQRWCRAPLAGSAPRVLCIVAHPDDEVLGLGARMASVAAELHVAYVSDGAPENECFYRPLGFERREHYAAARRTEARRALELAGVAGARAHELGVTDQQVTPALERVVDWLVSLIPTVAPEAVLTHAYEGGHPDHDATACAVHVALECLGRSRPLWEFASYHLRGAELVRGQFIGEAGCGQECVVLDGVARQRKLRLLECHATQREFWSTFPLDAEHFRPAPRYDFKSPPAAPFFYDRVDWGVSGAAFLAGARRLLAAHGIAEPC